MRQLSMNELFLILDLNGLNQLQVFDHNLTLLSQQPVLYPTTHTHAKTEALSTVIETMSNPMYLFWSLISLGGLSTF
ncbi:MAG: hypothetical protein A3F10_01785 [Coxiella sp. RIFCSPHIGHO2_12_FULL_42_15]|nr:MAG: hypothetical protein A3F10_01785 [Coxiella sp. RIFCSPHIGHO2_12_FULL_42_15]